MSQQKDQGSEQEFQVMDGYTERSTSAMSGDHYVFGARSLVVNAPGGPETSNLSMGRAFPIRSSCHLLRSGFLNLSRTMQRGNEARSDGLKRKLPTSSQNLEQQRAACRNAAKTRHPPLAVLPPAPAQKLAARLIHALEGGVGIGLPLLYFGEYFRELPVYLGRSPCLDAAVDALLFSQLRFITHFPLDPGLELQKYGQALKLLQKQLQKKEVDTGPETLCSALVLSASEASHLKWHYRFIIFFTNFPERPSTEASDLLDILHMPMVQAQFFELMGHIASIRYSSCSFSMLMYQ